GGTGMPLPPLYRPFTADSLAYDPTVSYVTTPMMNNSKDRDPKRERRWQTSQERARVAAELIEEAESLTQTGAIATPNDVARDEQPPPIRVAQAQPNPRPADIKAKLDDGEPEPPAPPPPPTPPPPPPPS